MPHFTKDTPLARFIPFFHFLIQIPITNNAKVLYTLIYCRISLSRANGWMDSEERLYAKYTVKKMADDLGVSEKTVSSCLNELESHQLLSRISQGCNRPTLLFLLFPDNIEFLENPCFLSEAFSPDENGKNLHTNNRNNSIPLFYKNNNSSVNSSASIQKNDYSKDQELYEQMRGAYYD